MLATSPRMIMNSSPPMRVTTSVGLTFARKRRATSTSDVATAVPQSVVDELESIQVYVEERHVGIVDGRSLQHAREVLLQRSTVGEPGQVIVVRLEDEACLR